GDEVRERVRRLQLPVPEQRPAAGRADRPRPEPDAALRRRPDRRPGPAGAVLPRQRLLGPGPELRRAVPLLAELTSLFPRFPSRRAAGLGPPLWPARPGPAPPAPA